MMIGTMMPALLQGKAVQTVVVHRIARAARIPDQVAVGTLEQDLAAEKGDAFPLVVAFPVDLQGEDPVLLVPDSEKQLFRFAYDNYI